MTISDEDLWADAIEVAGGGDYEEHPVWSHVKPGDQIIGTVSKRKDDAATKFGPKMVLELTDAERVISEGDKRAKGTYVVWPTPALADLIKRESINEGDRIGIRLNELKDTGKGNPFKVFVVKVVERAAAVAAVGDDEW